MSHEPRNRQRSRWVPEVAEDRKGLQTLFAFAYGVQVGRMRRIGADLQKLANQSQLATMATGAAIAIGIQDQIECIARSGTAAPALGSRIDATIGLSGECIRTGLAQLCADTETHPFVDRLHSRSAGVRSIVYVPLFRGVQPAGVIGVFCDKPDHFTQHDLRVLTLIGREVTKLLKWEPSPGAMAPLRTQPLGTPIAAAAPAVAPLETPSLEAAGVSPDLTVEAKSVEIQEPVIETPETSSTKHVDTGQLIDETFGSATAEAAPQSLTYLDEDSQYPATVPSFLFADEHRIPRWMTVVAVAVVLAVGVAAIWYLIPYFTRDASESAGPMVYGPPQVTSDSTVQQSSPQANQVATQSIAKDSEAKPELLPTEAEKTVPTSSGAPTVIPPTKLPVKAARPRVIVQAVTTQVVGGHTFVSIHLTGSAQFQTHQLRDPDRIYVDLHDVEVDAELKETKLSGAGPIADFRFSQSGKNVARLVLVLDAPCTYLVSATANPYIVVFDIQPQRVKAAR